MQIMNRGNFHYIFIHINLPLHNLYIYRFISYTMIKSGVSNKKAQLTLFIFITIVIVLAIILFFVFRGSFLGSSIPQNMRPVYDSYLDCLEDITEDGVYILGQQGGYIEVPEFVPGSSYRPFSNQLEFMGHPVVYWMYISGNNIIKEQIPTKEDMEAELETYVQDRLDLCKFTDYEVQGYAVFIEEGDVNVKIKDSSVTLNAENPLTIYFGNDTVIVNKHNVDLDIRLGKMYDQAKELYNYEKTETFLEKYSIDTLRLYAPVDGVELGCTPIIFNDEEIRENLTKGLTANINSLKVKGSYYKLTDEENKYFVVNPGFKTDTNVNFIYDPSWPTRIEIYGDRVAKPIGLQEGLSMLGFCYVPYHLVYDVNFPVLIQFWENDFFFQFPVSVIIEKNYAREALPPMYEAESIESEVCKYKNQNVKVYTYDSNLNPLPSRLQFRCLNSQCEIGQSKFSGTNAIYEGPMPECINGFIVASAEGYAETKHQISTNQETSADIILPKIYKMPLDLGNVPGSAVITFSGEKHSTTVLYPDMKEAGLIEDYYNVSVFVYTDTKLTVQGISDQKCVDVPVEGIGGLFGLTEERCQEINIPDMEIESALIGGGKTQDYMTEDTLKKSRELNIEIPIFNEPQTIEDIQQNYVIVEDSPVYLSFE